MHRIARQPVDRNAPPPASAAADLIAAARVLIQRRYGRVPFPVRVVVSLDADLQPVGQPTVELTPVNEAIPGEALTLAALPPTPKRKRSRNVSDECLADVIDLLEQVGHRLTGDEVIRSLEKAGRRWPDSTVRHTLSYFTNCDRPQLSNDQHGDPQGYGLPCWD